MQKFNVLVGEINYHVEYWVSLNKEQDQYIFAFQSLDMPSDIKAYSHRAQRQFVIDNLDEDESLTRLEEIEANMLKSHWEDLINSKDVYTADKVDEWLVEAK